MSRLPARAAVLVSAARTPVGRFGGALAGVSALDLGGLAVAGALTGLDPALATEHVFLGNVVQAGSGQNPARVAAIKRRRPDHGAGHASTTSASPDDQHRPRRHADRGGRDRLRGSWAGSSR